MKKIKKLMVLGAGVYQVPLIKKAKEMGLYVIVVSYKGNYPGFGFADKVYHIDTTDIYSVLEAARKEKIDGICTTGTDVALHALGYVCDEMRVNGVSAKAAENSTDKLKMKSALLKHGIRTAAFGKARNFEEAAAVYESLKKPVIAKRVDSSGSRGIYKIKDLPHLKGVCKEILKTTKKDYFIIEEFIEGVEIGAEAFVQNGKVEFVLPNNKIMFYVEAGVPAGHSIPLLCNNKEIYDDIVRQVSSGINALEMNNCAVNADIMISQNKAYIIEMGARAGATCLPEQVSIYYGFDYYEKIIKASLGYHVKFALESGIPSSSSLIMAEKTGIIKSIKNHNLISENFVDISFDYGPGDAVKKFRVGPDRIGQIIVKGKTIEEADRLLNDCLNNIKIEISGDTK